MRKDLAKILQLRVRARYRRWCTVAASTNSQTSITNDKRPAYERALVANERRRSPAGRCFSPAPPSRPSVLSNPVVHRQVPRQVPAPRSGSKSLLPAPLQASLRGRDGEERPLLTNVGTSLHHEELRLVHVTLEDLEVLGRDGLVHHAPVARETRRHDGGDARLRLLGVRLHVVEKCV